VSDAGPTPPQPPDREAPPTNWLPSAAPNPPDPAAAPNPPDPAASPTNWLPPAAPPTNWLPQAAPSPAEPAPLADWPMPLTPPPPPAEAPWIRVPPAAPQPAQYPYPMYYAAAEPPRRSRTGLVVGLIAAALVVVAASAWGFGVVFQSAHQRDAGSPTSPAVSTSDTSAESPGPSPSTSDTLAPSHAPGDLGALLLPKPGSAVYMHTRGPGNVSIDKIASAYTKPASVTATLRRLGYESAAAEQWSEIDGSEVEIQLIAFDNSNDASQWLSDVHAGNLGQNNLVPVGEVGLITNSTLMVADTVDADGRVYAYAMLAQATIFESVRTWHKGTSKQATSRTSDLALRQLAALPAPTP
jgi:hypothetical protein